MDFFEQTRTRRFCRSVLSGLIAVLFAGLALMNLLHTASISSAKENWGPEYVTYHWEALWVLVPMLLIAVLYMLLVDRLSQIPTDQLARKITLIIFLSSAVWALLVDMSPRADSDIVLRIAVEWQNGDFHEFNPGGYLFMFPYQMGYIALLALYGKIFGVGKYLPVQLVNALLIALVFWGLYRIAQLVMPEESDEGRSVLVLSMGCWCAMFYSTFVYGNVPALALAVLAIWCQLRWQVGGESEKYLFFSAVCIGVSVLLKTFSVIILIAQLIILLLSGRRRSLRTVLIWLLLALLFWRGSSAALTVWAEHQYGGELNKGAPMIGTIAMGLQLNQDGIRAPGWWNGYNANVYRNAGFDAELAREMAVDSIGSSLRAFRHDPEMARRFFSQKVLSQWAEPTYQCFWIACTGDYPPWMESVFDGWAHELIVLFMNGYQSLIWLSAAAYVLKNRKKLSLEHMLPALVILGGFLFQLIWEGKGQYTMGYFVLALPYAAGGFQMLWDYIAARREGSDPTEYRRPQHIRRAM